MTDEGITWLHGTTVDSAQAIVDRGFRGATAGSRAWTAPLPDRAYITRNLQTALDYAFHRAAPRRRFSLPHHYPNQGWWLSPDADLELRAAILFVAPVDLSTCVPDEDWLGELLLRGSIAYEPTEPALLELLRDVFVKMPVRTRQRWTNMPTYYSTRLPTQAQQGKVAIKQLQKTAEGRSLLAQLLEHAPDVSCADNTVRVIAAFELSVGQVPELYPDGSNLADVGTPILPSGRA